MTKVTVGCDPELFVRGKNSGVFISGHNLIPGTKHNPFKVNKGAVQVDGTALEFNIDPADNWDDFHNNIHVVLSELYKMVQEANPKVELAFTPVANFSMNYFNSIPLKARELGCDPDFNAWTMEENPKPDSDRPFRTASGHIHVGWTEDKKQRDMSHISDCVKVIKQLDACLYLPSLKWDKDQLRRQLYGQMGAFRPKPYGAEYRVLSNVWLTDPRLEKFVFDSTIHAMKLLDDGVELAEEDGVSSYLHSKYFGGPDVVNDYLNKLNEKGFPKLPSEYLL